VPLWPYLSLAEMLVFIKSCYLRITKAMRLVYLRIETQTK